MGLLTDISIDWSGMPVTDVYPARLPDLFSAEPVIVSGRYTAGAKGTIRLQGKMAGQNFVREIPIELPDRQDVTTCSVHSGHGGGSRISCARR